MRTPQLKQAAGRTTGVLLSVMLGGALLAGPALAADDLEQDQDGCSSAMNIFLQEGASGSLVENDSGDYTLTVSDVLPYTVYFADRPAKDSGFIPLDKFIDNFSWVPEDPPNAAIILREEDDEQDIIVAELTAPTYDEAAGTLQYSIKVIDEYDARSDYLQQVQPHADASIPDTFGSVILVIDSCPCLWAPAQGCNDSHSCNSTKWHWLQFLCNYDGDCCDKCYISPEPSPEP
ncbi:MAG: hypothetical protein U9O18_04470 [Chloroflexota bacterium]|nr:hypothetical protein [Chloroflexota bacterium]